MNDPKLTNIETIESNLYKLYTILNDVVQNNIIEKKTKIGEIVIIKRHLLIIYFKGIGTIV